MQTSERIIQQLLEQSSDKFYYVSLYLPINGITKLEIKKRLKSLLLTALRDSDTIGNYSRLHTKLLNNVLSLIESSDIEGKGLAIFSYFDPLEHEKRDQEIKDKQTTIILLDQIPIAEYYTGNTFDIDQLVFLSHTPKSLIVLLEANSAKLYSLHGSHAELISSLENDERYEKEKEYIHTYSPTRGDQVFHGTGSSNLERLELQESREFLDKVEAFIFSTEIKDLDYLFVFHSKSITELLNDFRKSVISKIKVSEIVIEPHIFRDGDVKDIIRKLVEEKQTGKIESRLDEAKEDFKRFSSGWKNVTRNARDGKVETLFIKPELKRAGYVSGKSLPYTYPAKGSKLVNNISPFLVRNVVQSGGSVVVLDGNKETEIAAHLRY
jgi:hypothetical protein